LYNCCCCCDDDDDDGDGCSGRYVDGNDVIDVDGVDLDIIGGGGMYLSGVTCDMVFVISIFGWLGMIEM
jgi:hypothetical protein